MCTISLSDRGLEGLVGRVSECLGVLLRVLGFAFVLSGAFFRDLIFDFFLDDVLEFELDFLFLLCILLLGVAAFCMCWNDSGTFVVLSLIAVCFTDLECCSRACCSMVAA